METKVNYILVGLFTLALGAALVAGILWLSAGGQYRKVYDTYYAYMNESVSGLNLNAPVKYRGVEVGRVREIALDPSNIERVRLVLDIERGTPVKEDTVAVLRVQGLTGIAFVELSGGSHASLPLQRRGTERYPVIRTGPSLLTRLDNTITALLASLTRTSDSLNALLDEDNRRALKKSIANLETVSRTLAGRSAAIDAGMAGAARTLENTARATSELQGLVDRAQRAAEAVERMANEASRTARETSRVVGEVPDALDDMQTLAEDLRGLAASLRRVADQVERDPSVLLYGRRPPAPGPGE